MAVVVVLETSEFQQKAVVVLAVVGAEPAVVAVVLHSLAGRSGRLPVVVELTQVDSRQSLAKMAAADSAEQDLESVVEWLAVAPLYVGPRAFAQIAVECSVAALEPVGAKVGFRVDDGAAPAKEPLVGSALDAVPLEPCPMS